MTIAARRDRIARKPPPSIGRAHAAAASRIAVFDDFAAAEPVWRALEAERTCASPYQRFGWISAWFNHVGRAEGATPLLVAGFDRTGMPGFILPFISMRRYGCHVAAYGGGTHSNLNLPVWRHDFPPDAGVLDEIAALREIDLFALTGQPQSWQGVRHPFAGRLRQPSVDDVYTGRLNCGDALAPRLPSGLRKKERKLMRLAGFGYAKAETAAEVDAILAAFHAQKADRFARKGIRNVFAERGVGDFIRAACLDGLTEGRPAIELHTLSGDGEFLAILGGVASAERFSVMFVSITEGPRRRLSPGIILMSRIAAAGASRGIANFDLGAGTAPYKALFCPTCEQRFDCFVPFSARGSALAAAYRASGALRHAFKTSPALMGALEITRRWRTVRAYGD